MISVYCDESGNLADSDCIVFAAAVAEDSDWLKLGKDWRATLKQAGIRYLHAKDALRKKGEFRHWSESDRDDLLEQLAEVANKRIAFNYSFDMDAMKFRALSQATRARLRNPTYCAFEGLLRAIAHEHQENPDMRFHLVYDLSEEYSTHCLKLFHRMRSQTEYRQFFPVLTFGDDQEMPALQVADMLAYCRREEVLQGGAANCRPIIRRLLEILSSGGLLVFGAIGYRGGATLVDCPRGSFSMADAA